MMISEGMVGRPPSLGPGHNSGRLSSAQGRQLTALRRLIWLYFWVLIFEGALRKWIVPSLSHPLLIIRDPLVLLIYLQAGRWRRFLVDGPVLAYFTLLACFILLSV